MLTFTVTPTSIASSSQDSQRDSAVQRSFGSDGNDTATAAAAAAAGTNDILSLSEHLPIPFLAEKLQNCDTIYTVDSLP
jgi:hypothetical protein